MAYASRTGTKVNLAALRAAGWRLMVSARGSLRTEGFKFALDNGAWTAFQRGEPFDVAAFERAVDKLGRDADFVVLPDIVGGGLESLRMSLDWIERLRGRCATRLIPVQEGMTSDDVAPHLGPGIGVFVGGIDDKWKERTTPEWARLAHERGAWCHVGRVNSQRRIRICADAGVDSFDGSKASRRLKHVRMLDRAVRQQSLLRKIT